ncbi:hypothetical protein JCM5350_003185 [Sporobolomyces pararoseus]
MSYSQQIASARTGNDPVQTASRASETSAQRRFAEAQKHQQVEEQMRRDEAELLEQQRLKDERAMRFLKPHQEAARYASPSTSTPNVWPQLDYHNEDELNKVSEMIKDKYHVAPQYKPVARRESTKPTSSEPPHTTRVGFYPD